LISKGRGLAPLDFLGDRGKEVGREGDERMVGGRVDEVRSEPRSLQEQHTFHDFYGVAADADVVDLVGGFAGADEKFAGAVGFDALADQDLLMGKTENSKMEKRNWSDGEKSKSPRSEKRGVARANHYGALGLDA
jgi:hypothetical protein